MSGWVFGRVTCYQYAGHDVFLGEKDHTEAQGRGRRESGRASAITAVTPGQSVGAVRFLSRHRLWLLPLQR